MKYIQFTKKNSQDVKNFITNYFNEIDKEVYLWITESSLDGVIAIEFKYEGCLLQLELNNYVVIDDDNNKIDIVTEDKFKEYINSFNYKFSKRPNQADIYFNIAPYGNIAINKWCNHFTDEDRHNNCNCFKDRTTAENFAKIQLLQRKLLQFSLENGMDKIDWNNRKQEKYYIFYNCKSKEYDIDAFNSIKDVNEVYFRDKEIAKNALKLFKNDLEEVRNIKW